MQKMHARAFHQNEKVYVFCKSSWFFKGIKHIKSFSTQLKKMFPLCVWVILNKKIFFLDKKNHPELYKSATVSEFSPGEGVLPAELTAVKVFPRTRLLKYFKHEGLTLILWLKQRFCFMNEWLHESTFK